MKKVILFLVIAVLSPLLLNTGVHAASCDDDSTVCNGFVNVSKTDGIYLCDAGMSINEGAVSIEMNNGPKSLILNKMGRVCKMSSAPANFHISFVGPNFDVPIIGSLASWINICPDGYHTPLVSAGVFYETIDPLTAFCCPPTHPYVSSLLVLKGCAINPNSIVFQDIGRWTIQIGVIGAGPGSLEWEIRGGFGAGQGMLENPHLAAFTCGGIDISPTWKAGDGCAVTALTDGYIEESKFAPNLVRATEISGHQCIANKEPTNINSCVTLPNTTPADSCMCWRGSSISRQIFTKVGPEGVKILDNCNNLPGAQKAQCVLCMSKNYVTDPTGKINSVPKFTFSSSFGCIDTTQNGFITRVIQIGLGIGSGIALIRIIQGGFLRQTNDPAKIQEGNEILISTFLAMGVLVGAILILRIIGVDILGIFTIGQFNVITN